MTDFQNASTGGRVGILGGTKALAFLTKPGRDSASATNSLLCRSLGPRHAGTAERIVAIRDCGAECGLGGIWVSGALGDVRGARRSLLVEIEKCGVWRGFDESGQFLRHMEPRTCRCDDERVTLSRS